MLHKAMTAEDYRVHAAQERAVAYGTELPRVREQHLRSADKWDFLALEADALQAGLRAMFGDGERQIPDLPN